MKIALKYPLWALSAVAILVSGLTFSGSSSLARAADAAHHSGVIALRNGSSRVHGRRVLRVHRAGELGSPERPHRDASNRGAKRRVETEHVGRAWSADESGTLVALERSTTLNCRLAYGLELLLEREAEMFLHIDNLTDMLVEPQLGLPAPGWPIRVGVKIG